MDGCTPKGKGHVHLVFMTASRKSLRRLYCNKSFLRYYRARGFVYVCVCEFWEYSWTWSHLIINPVMIPKADDFKKLALLALAILSELQETVMDREAWHAAIHGVARVGHDWATELNWTLCLAKCALRGHLWKCDLCVLRAKGEGLRYPLQSPCPAPSYWRKVPFEESNSLFSEYNSDHQCVSFFPKQPILDTSWVSYSSTQFRHYPEKASDSTG